LRTAGPIWLFLFLMFVIVRMRFLGKQKLEKLPEKSGKTESAFFYVIFPMNMRNSFFVLFVMVLEKFSGKKIRHSYKGKSENSDKLVIFEA
jgi:hypothetical protein